MIQYSDFKKEVQSVYCKPEVSNNTWPTVCDYNYIVVKLEAFQGITQFLHNFQRVYGVPHFHKQQMDTLN